MQNGKLQKLPLGDIKPKGWFLDQLRTQAKGLTGNVAELFDDLSDNSSWLGGKGEKWERGPYYLDGLLPLAYLIDDYSLKQKSQKWIDSILESQDALGFFGPKNNLDWWPRMVITKMLPSYYEATKDERVVPFLTNYYTYMSKNIDKRPLYSWANARGIEELIGIDWLYKMTKKEFLISLGKKIIAQSIDWTEVFENFPYTKPSSEYMSSRAFNIKKVLFFGRDFVANIFNGSTMSTKKILKRNNHKFNKFYHLTHGVNIAMALKYPALTGCFLDDAKKADIASFGYNTIMQNHGTACGLYTCDEHLSGASPTQGIELCAVSEAMYSLEKLYQITDDNKWADLLELLCFSTYPATFTKDMCAHQYVQQVNQISATTAKRGWYDSYKKANIFGLKPNYACCLSNMHQGFPKFAEHLAFVTDTNALSLLSLVPMKIDTQIQGKDVSLEVVSDYPFKNSAVIKIEKGQLNLRIRIPENAKSVFIDFKKFTGSYAQISVKAGQKISVSYDFDIVKKKNFDCSVSYYYGNLLLALPILPNVVYKEQNNLFCDREMSTDTMWNYAPDDSKGFTLVEKNIASVPFFAPPISFKIKGYEIPAWTEQNNQASPIPKEYVKGQETVLTLVPYGSTVLRIAHFPEIKY
jgi:hypothetical protein